MKKAPPPDGPSRYHGSRLRFMGGEKSPTCKQIISLAPQTSGHRLVLPFQVAREIHILNVDFPPGLDPAQAPPVFRLGVAMSEAYRLAEIITPRSVHFPWYPCAGWEQAWWQEDICWYLQQKFYLEHWPWSRMPRIIFPTLASHRKAAASRKGKFGSGYLLAVSGGKESTFAWEWLRRAGLPHEAFTLHHSGGVLGTRWESKFPVFECIRAECALHEFRQHPESDPAVRFGYEGVRNDPTITNALFLMMMVAQARGLRYLALANDRSSNEANALHEGRPVNHQSAKGTAYIARFNRFCAAKGLPFRYISMCEKAYSLGAVAALAKWNAALLPRLASCNEAQWSTKTDLWCRACPKCAFSYALLEAAAGRSLAVSTVGEDLIRKPSLLPTWRALWNPKLEKPFECVGERRETAAALGKIKHDRARKRLPLEWLQDVPETPAYSSYTRVSPPSGIPRRDRRQLSGALGSF